MSFLGKEPFYFKSLPTTDGCQLITVKPNQAKVREQEGRGGQWREVGGFDWGPHRPVAPHSWSRVTRCLPQGTGRGVSPWPSGTGTRNERKGDEGGGMRCTFQREQKPVSVVSMGTIFWVGRSGVYG